MIMLDYAVRAFPATFTTYNPPSPPPTCGATKTPTQIQTPLNTPWLNISCPSMRSLAMPLVLQLKCSDNDLQVMCFRREMIKTSIHTSRVTAVDVPCGAKKRTDGHGNDFGDPGNRRELVSGGEALKVGHTDRNTLSLRGWVSTRQKENKRGGNTTPRESKHAEKEQRQGCMREI